MFGDTPVGKDEDDAELPSAEDADAEQNGETVDDYSEGLPADSGKGPMKRSTPPPNSETVEKPQRISRKKKTTAASETAAAEVSCSTNEHREFYDG